MRCSDDSVVVDECSPAEGGGHEVVALVVEEQSRLPGDITHVCAAHDLGRWVGAHAAFWKKENRHRLIIIDVLDLVIKYGQNCTENKL